MPAPFIAFLTGLPFGLAVYFFCRIVHRVTLDLGVRRQALALFAICAVAFTGAAGFSQIGSTMNEWTTTALVMVALFLLVRNVSEGQALNVSTSVVAGVASGAAAGLKLTAVVYVIGLSTAALLFFGRRRDSTRGLLSFATGIIFGFLVTYGFWGLALWKRFGSPFFPFFNGIFRSVYWEPLNFFDTRFRTHGLAWLTFPFRLAKGGAVASEIYQREPRLAVLVALVIALVVSRAWAWRRYGSRSDLGSRLTPRASVVFLVEFLGASYLVWLATFVIYRYAIPIELVASLLLVLTLRLALAENRARDLITSAVLGAIIATTAAPDWGRGPFRTGRYIDVRLPSLPEDSIVLILSREPFGYIVPFIDSRSRAVRPISNFTGPDHHNRLEQELSEIVANQLGPMYVIRYLDVLDPAEEQALETYRLRRVDDRCQAIESNLEANRRLGICPVIRRS